MELWCCHLRIVETVRGASILGARDPFRSGRGLMAATTVWWGRVSRLRRRHADLIYPVALFSAVFLCPYLLWPYSMGGMDEGAFLYEAKRAFDGEVMYRD